MNLKMKLNYPNFDTNIIKKINKILKSGRVNYWTGNECENFENEFSNYHKVKYSLSAFKSTSIL